MANFRLLTFDIYQLKISIHLYNLISQIFYSAIEQKLAKQKHRTGRKGSAYLNQEFIFAFIVLIIFGKYKIVSKKKLSFNKAYLSYLVIENFLDATNLVSN